MPKGAYRRPEGGIVMLLSTTTYVDGNGKVRQITIQAVRRENPDLRRLARAFIELARQEVAEQARLDAEKQSTQD